MCDKEGGGKGGGKKPTICEKELQQLAGQASELTKLQADLVKAQEELSKWRPEQDVKNEIQGLQNRIHDLLFNAGNSGQSGASGGGRSGRVGVGTGRRGFGDEGFGQNSSTIAHNNAGAVAVTAIAGMGMSAQLGNTRPEFPTTSQVSNNSEKDVPHACSHTMCCCCKILYGTVSKCMKVNFDP